MKRGVGTDRDTPHPQGMGFGLRRKRKIKMALKNNTPGRSKGIHASTLQKYACKHSRARKLPWYEDALKTIGKRSAGVRRG